MSDEHVEVVHDIDSWMVEQARLTEERNANLHDEQRKVDWGDCFVRFYPLNEQTVLSIFGQVETVEQFRSLEKAAGADDQELDEEVRTLEAMHANGFLYAKHYSTIEPGGEYGSTHRYHCWPISVDVYESARAAGWDVSAMEPQTRDTLKEIYSQFRRHVTGEEEE